MSSSDTGPATGSASLESAAAHLMHSIGVGIFRQPREFFRQYFRRFFFNFLHVMQSSSPEDENDEVGIGCNLPIGHRINDVEDRVEMAHEMKQMKCK